MPQIVASLVHAPPILYPDERTIGLELSSSEPSSRSR
jgi:ABC-type uncharacterized transport system ATPase subunit